MFGYLAVLAFIAFAVIGCPLIAAGVLLYVYSLLRWVLRGEIWIST